MSDNSGQVRPLWEIARDIRRDWKPVGFAAKPYVEVMGQLDKLSDKYICTDGRAVVEKFLGNAATWRGETAKRIKAELRAMVGRK